MFIIPIVLAATFAVRQFAGEAIDRRLAGADASVALARFVGYPTGATQDKFTPNPKFWLKDVDFSCASPWNSGCGSLRAGTLISRRHIIFAKHYPLWKGVRIVFVDREGKTCPCRVEATKAVKDYDIMVGLLDYEVTPNIRPAKILPEDYEKHIGNGKGLPVVTFNQREEAFLSWLHSITSDTVMNVTATNETWKSLGGRLVGGDSGNPAFALIGNEPILIYCLHSGGAGHGPSVFHYRREIQKAMDELCPGYKLEAFDFSTLPNPSSLGAIFQTPERPAS